MCGYEPLSFTWLSIALWFQFKKKKCFRRKRPSGLAVSAKITKKNEWRWSSVRLFATPWTLAHQAPPSMGFSRQEYWSGWPCPPPGDLPHSGIEPSSLLSPALAGRFFTTRATSDALMILLPKMQPVATLILTHGDWFWTSDFQRCEMAGSCYFFLSHWGCGNVLQQQQETNTDQHFFHLEVWLFPSSCFLW